MILSFALVSSAASRQLTGRVSKSSVTYAEGIDQSGDCWATWSETLNTTGWHELTLESRQGLSGASAGLCVGYLEGVLIATPLLQSVNLWKDQEYGSRNVKGFKSLLDFYHEHIIWLNESIDAYQDVLYWRQVNAIYQIFIGILNGYNSVRPNNTFTFEELFAYNALGDTMELDWWLQDEGYITTSDKTRCTALIVLSSDRKDIYFAHDTWDDYRNLHSVIIHYNLPCEEFASPRVTLSTQLGLVSSVDDFFITGAGLMIFETSMEVENSTLYELYVKPQTVMNWVRTALGAFTATNVGEWEDAFLKHNSGTYNNEYFIVDTKLLNADTQVSSNLVHSVFQAPGPERFIEDLTAELYSEGFISSFNVPKNQAAAKYIGWDEAVALGGPNGCHYSECPRYLISKRESPRLANFTNFRNFMRYAGYKRDAYSLYHGQPYHSYCISARGDTDDDESRRRTSGGLNTKVCRASEAATKMVIYGVNAPSFDEPDQNWPLNWGLPPFTRPGINHDGLPDVWNFSWVTVSNPGFNLCAKETSLETCKAVNFCGWCGEVKKCLPGDKEGPYFEASCSSGWESGPSPEVNVGLIVGLSVGGFVVLVVIIAALVAWRRSNRVPVV
jgi:hypothetical protein